MYFFTLCFKPNDTGEKQVQPELQLHVCSCSFLFQFCVFRQMGRVISAQTDGESRCGAPEGKDACCARSDQAEFCSQRGNDVQLHLGFVLLVGVRQVQGLKLP